MRYNGSWDLSTRIPTVAISPRMGKTPYLFPFGRSSERVGPIMCGSHHTDLPCNTGNRVPRLEEYTIPGHTYSEEERSHVFE